jgi:hypothetical protein
MSETTASANQAGEITTIEKQASCAEKVAAAAD